VLCHVERQNACIIDGSGWVLADCGSIESKRMDMGCCKQSL
jgi:hypothetical protein